MAPGPDYARLAVRVRDGDRNAFDALVRAFWQRVQGYFWRRVGSDADELAQSVFVNVYRGVRRGAGSRLADEESWSRYLFGVARNVWRDHRRLAQRPATGLEDLFGEEGSLARDANDPRTIEGSEALADAETRAALEACLAELEDPGRELVWLHFVEGRSKRELARHLDRPESSLRSEMVRLLERLRRCVTSRGVSL